VDFYWSKQSVSKFVELFVSINFVAILKLEGQQSKCHVLHKQAGDLLIKVCGHFKR
jgi:hypothetical protein